jgi:hypothetical protein
MQNFLFEYTGLFRQKMFPKNRNPLLRILPLFLIAAYACIDPEVRRLQTNQAVEGEELYRISKALDEHLFYAFQSFLGYNDSVKVANLPGCPSVALEGEEQEVRLTFSSGTCQGTPILRRGSILLKYQKSPITHRDMVLVTYEEYHTGEATLKGQRALSLVASSRESRTWEDRASGLEIIYPSGSRSKHDLSLTHTVEQTYLTGLTGFSTIGQSSGRNQTGRKTEMQIMEAKQFQGNCLTQNLHRPISGSEIWTIERTTTGPVQHRLNFQRHEGCQTHTLIHLAEGVEMQKAP